MENIQWDGPSGFKLHLIINDKGEILNFMFTPENVDDREPLKQGKFFVEHQRKTMRRQRDILVRLCLRTLFFNGIQLVTKVKNNMKNSLMSIADKILLRKRALIETVNDRIEEH